MVRPGDPSGPPSPQGAQGIYPSLPFPTRPYQTRPNTSRPYSTQVVYQSQPTTLPHQTLRKEIHSHRTCQDPTRTCQGCPPGVVNWVSPPPPTDRCTTLSVPEAKQSESEAFGKLSIQSKTWSSWEVILSYQIIFRTKSSPESY